MKIKELLQNLFPEDYQAWMILLEVTDQLQYFENKDLPSEALIDLLNDCLQKNWLRPKDKERWEISTKYTPTQHAVIEAALDQMGLFREIKPTQKKYDCAFLMSAWEGAVMARLNNLIQLWEDGLRFDRLYVMSAHRDLCPLYESNAIETLKGQNIRLNEIEMMRHIISEYLKNTSVFSGNPPQIIYDDAQRPEGARRANTMDSFISWSLNYADKNQDRKILIISCQPFVHYQSAVAFQVLSDNYQLPVYKTHQMETKGKIDDRFDIEAIGHGKPSEELPDIGLDSLARFVFSSKENWKNL